MSKSNKCIIYTVEETAELLGVSVNTVYNSIRDGDLPSVKLRRRQLIPKSAIDKLFDIAA